MKMFRIVRNPILFNKYYRFIVYYPLTIHSCDKYLSVNYHSIVSKGTENLISEDYSKFFKNY
jgi:hypothetical protein